MWFHWCFPVCVKNCAVTSLDMALYIALLPCVAVCHRVSPCVAVCFRASLCHRDSPCVTVCHRASSDGRAAFWRWGGSGRETAQCVPHRRRRGHGDRRVWTERHPQSGVPQGYVLPPLLLTHTHRHTVQQRLTRPGSRDFQIYQLLFIVLQLFFRISRIVMTTFLNSVVVFKNSIVSKVYVSLRMTCNFFLNGLIWDWGQANLQTVILQCLCFWTTKVVQTWLNVVLFWIIDINVYIFFFFK